jgi:uncharacterized membrane protein
MIQQLAYIVLLGLTPVVELRGALIWAYTVGIPPLTAIPVAVISSTILGLLSYGLADLILSISKRHFAWYHRKIHKHASSIVEKSGIWLKLGVILFVGIPAPGTGAFTGGIVAAVLGFTPRTAAICIVLGNLLASLLITLFFFPFLL